MWQNLGELVEMLKFTQDTYPPGMYVIYSVLFPVNHEIKQSTSAILSRSHMTSLKFKMEFQLSKDRSTVDGRNPAPPGMYKTLWILGYLLDQLVQDFFQQQYEREDFSFAASQLFQVCHVKDVM